VPHAPIRRRALLAVGGLVAAASLAACGTRLPDSAFPATSVQPAGGSPAADGAATAAGTDPAADPGLAALASPGAPAGSIAGSGAAGAAGDGGAAAPAAGTVTGPEAAGGSQGTGTGTGTKGVTKGVTKGGSTTGSTGGGTKAAPTQGGTAAAVNHASDRGVTPTTITVCNIVTRGGPFGPDQFTPSLYGAAAFFADLNAHGGVGGRQVVVKSHPDDGTSSGDDTQVHTCIDEEKAFAFVGNNIYQYGGVSYQESQDVPDIGAQPISTAYYTYPHLYSVLGVQTPRDGTHTGYDGTGYGTAEQGEFFKQRVGVTHVGVVYYDQASSQYGATEIGGALEAAGLTVTSYPVNLGLPNFSSVVAQMQSDGVDGVADALDLNGNQKLCQAVESSSGFLTQMKAKISTTASWNQSVGSDFASTPGCRGKIYVDGNTWSYADPGGNAQVAAFRAAMTRYFPSQAGHLAEWSLEGWAGAMWFTDAVRSCGANLTRACVEAYLDRPAYWDSKGLMLSDESFEVYPVSYYNSPTTHCVSAAQWDNAAGTWVTRAQIGRDCFSAPGYPYAFSPPS